MKKKGIRFLSTVMALALMLTALPLAGLADDSTSANEGHVYKDMTPNTQLYVLTNTPGASYKNYGAKYEPNGGVLYGRTTHGGSIPADIVDKYWSEFGIGGEGNLNFLENQEESIIGLYTSVTDPYPISHWSYLFNPSLLNGKHSLLIYMNFDNKDADCVKVVNGEYDQKLIADFQYLNTLDCPVFMRVGGEMNNWSKDPETFKKAYQHIGALRDQYGSKVALVFSPVYNPGYKTDLDEFYPGDTYVDWIGVSLYFNKYQYNTATGSFFTSANDEMGYGVGDVYGDPVLNVQPSVNLAKLHNKPLMITEGGSAHSIKGQTVDDNWVAERISKELAFLPMLYPQIKAIVMSDYGKNNGENYTFYDNSTITSAFRKAVSELGVYQSDAKTSGGKYLTPLSDLPDLAATSGDLRLFGYTYSSEKLTATLYIDNAAVGTSSDYPYAFTVSRDALLTGSHTVRVEFSNNQKIGYNVVDGKVTSADAGAKAEEPDSWARDEVYRAIGLGVIPAELQKGYTNKITRAQFAAMAVQTYETLTGTTVEGRVTFNDTSDVNVEKLAYLGVVGGTGEGTFSPNDLIQRQQAAKIFCELAEKLEHPLPASTETPVFADMDEVEPYAVEYIGKVASNAIMFGDTDDGRGHIFPKNSITVEESILMLVRLIGKIS